MLEQFHRLSVDLLRLFYEDRVCVQIKSDQ